MGNRATQTQSFLNLPFALGLHFGIFMNNFRALVFLSILFASLLAAKAGDAKESLPTAVKSKLQEIYPGATEFEWEVGPINSDKVNDLAVLVSIANRESQGTEALAIFYGDPKGGFRLEANSLTWSKSERISWHITFAKGSVFLEMECAALCGWANSVGGYQFKEVKGEIVLIGENIDTYTNTASTNDGGGYSINYLTRQKIVWRSIGKKRKEVKKRFAEFSPLSLRQFNRWEKNDPRPKDIGGYIDENLKYVAN
jgi:hypothetical protein